MNKIGKRKIFRRVETVNVSAAFMRDIATADALLTKMLYRYMKQKRAYNGWLPWRPVGLARIKRAVDGDRTYYRMTQQWEDRYIGRKHR